MLKRLIIVLFVVFPVFAQTTHKTTLTWTDSTNADVYRAQATCDFAPSFAKVATSVASPYVDTTVQAGVSYCYYVIEQPSNVPSNLVEVDVPSDGTVAVKAAKQTAGATVN